VLYLQYDHFEYSLYEITSRGNNRVIFCSRINIKHVLHVTCILSKLVVGVKFNMFVFHDNALFCWCPYGLLFYEFISVMLMATLYILDLKAKDDSLNSVGYVDVINLKFKLFRLIDFKTKIFINEN